ncbi:MAG: hypothetical protein AAF548_18550, partial [Actinomycetota bacterium]
GQGQGEGQGQGLSPEPGPCGSLYGLDLETRLSFRSDFALGAPCGGPPLHLVVGDVVDDGPVTWQSIALPQVSCRVANSRAHLRWERAAFSIDRDRVVVEASDPAFAFERHFNPVLSLVVGARGGLALHAFTVRLAEVTIAVCGRSGYGKSSLGLALLDRGAALVGDDLLAIDDTDLVHPGPGFIRLESDDRSEWDPGGKRRISVAAQTEPVGLDAVVVLERGRDGIEPLDRPMDAVQALVQQIYNPVVLDDEMRQRNLDHVARLAGSTPVIAVPRHHAPPDELADRVLGRLSLT